jgi:hypothetical protein
MAEVEAEPEIDPEPETDPLVTEASSEGTTPEHLAPPPSSEVLPDRVPERDPSATQVGPAAYLHVWDSNPGDSTRSGGWGGCLLRMAILSVFAIAAVGIGLGSFALYQYYALLRDPGSSSRKAHLCADGENFPLHGGCNRCHRGLRLLQQPRI